MALLLSFEERPGSSLTSVNTQGCLGSGSVVVSTLTPGGEPPQDTFHSPNTSEGTGPLWVAGPRDALAFRSTAVLLAATV